MVQHVAVFLNVSSFFLTKRNKLATPRGCGNTARCHICFWDTVSNTTGAYQHSLTCTIYMLTILKRGSHFRKKGFIILIYCKVYKTMHLPWVLWYHFYLNPDKSVVIREFVLNILFYALIVFLNLLVRKLSFNS